MLRESFLPIFQSGLRLLSLLALPALALLPACKYDSADVEWTIPSRGDSEVIAQPVIAIRLTNTMTASDLENTEPGMITVTGDQTSGEYNGTVVAANDQDVFAGQTIMEFQAGINQPPVLIDPLNPEAGVEEPAGDNTLVFLLNSTEQFKPGERITVTVSEDVTVLNVPFSGPYVFSFTVEGGEARSDGGLYVREVALSTSPPVPLQASGVAGLRPAVKAYLSESIAAGSEVDAVRMVGSQSGNHPGGLTRAEENEVLPSLVHVLGASDSFLPGEKVSVAFTKSITSADASALSPYQVTFQVRPGMNLDGWEPNLVTEENSPNDRAVAVLAADFMPGSGAVEMLTLSSTLATLYNSEGLQGTVEAPSGWTFTDAVTVDADGDGSVEMVALLLGSQDELRLQEYQVDDFGAITATDSRLDFGTLSEGADSAGSLYLADLDSDGLPELLALHGDGTFASDAEQAIAGGLPGLGDLGDLGLPVEDLEPESTGYLTIFQVTQGVSAEAIANLDIANLQETTQFVALRNPVSGFSSSRKIQLVDLDSDGRLDLVSETADAEGAGSLVLYRNQTTAANPFSFRKVGALKDSAGGDYSPDAWIAFDLDVDGDMDVVSWKGGSSFLHENSYRDVGGLLDMLLAGNLDDLNNPLESLSGDEPRGLLFENVVPEAVELGDVVARRGDILEASNLDGDPLGTSDLVVGGAGEKDRGSLVFLRNRSLPGVGQSFEKIELDAGEAGVVSGFALLDFNGDTGLDVATVSDDVALVYSSLGVQAATVPDPTLYRLQPVDTNGDEVTIEYLESLEAEAEFGVKVFADIRDSFSGYSVALEYDRFELDYLGFTEPSGFEQLGLFETCPQDPSDNNCIGFAAASMAYQQDTTGAAFDNVELGIFRFRCRQVFGRTDTTIGFAAAGATELSNVLTAVEAGVIQEVLVETGESIQFELEPPPPPELEVSCNVQERRALSSEVLISWQAQALRYDRVEIRLADGPPTYIDWDSGFYVVDVSTPGNISISVKALQAGSDIGPTAFCEVVHVPEPGDVRCGKDGDENIVTWDWGPGVPVEQFRIYRNGSFRGSTLPEAGFIFEDSSSTDDGSDLYEVSAVSGGVESSRGACSGLDPEPCDTEEPLRSPAVATLLTRSSPSAPLRIRWDWVNGEAYDLMTLDLSFESTAPDSVPVDLFGETGLELRGQDANRDFFIYEGDVDLGGATPGIYTLTLTATKNADQGCDGFPEGRPVDSDLVTFQPFTLNAPPLDEVTILCIKDSGGIAVSWDAPWRGYGDSMLQLDLEHSIDGTIVEEDSRTVFDILPSDTGYVFNSVEPIGTYQVTLSAGGDTASCVDGVLFTPTLSVDSVVVAIGEPSFEIPISATGLGGDIEAVKFDLWIPEAISLTSPALVEVATIDGRKKIEVREGDLELQAADGNSEVVLMKLLAELTGEVSEDHSIQLENIDVRFEGYTDWQPLSDVEGEIQYANSYLKLDLVPDTEDPAVFHVAVKGSLRAPSELSNYRFNAYTIHLQFNPDHLELLPVDQEQAGTVSEDLGEIFLPTDDTLSDINEAGDLKVGWISFNFSTLGTDFIDPFENETVLNLSFASKLAQDDPRAVSQISFVYDPTADQPTSFFPEQAVPGRPVIDAFLDATVTLGGDFPELMLDSVAPATGPLTGGNVVRLSGQGLDAGAGFTPGIRLVPVEGDAETVEVPPADINVLDSGAVIFTVPDALGPRPATIPASNSLVYDIELSVGGQEALLSEAYSYETPSLEGVDVSSLRATCGDFIELRGTGFSTDTVVKLEVEGLAPLFAIPHNRSMGRPAVAADGRTMLVRAPAEGLPVLDEAFVVIEVFYRDELDQGTPDAEPLERLELPTPLAIIEGECPQPAPNVLLLLQVQPEAVSICGGSQVDLFGDGFTERCEVLVDGVAVDSTGFVFHSGQHLSFIAPGRGTVGEARLQVRDPLTLAQSEDVLLYTSPPSFIRGDVDGNLEITESDVTLLSSLLFGGAGVWPVNQDAADINDDGRLNFGDLMRLLKFLQDPADANLRPPAPFPGIGSDPTPDDICE